VESSLNALSDMPVEFGLQFGHGGEAVESS